MDGKDPNRDRVDEGRFEIWRRPSPRHFIIIIGYPPMAVLGEQRLT